MSGLHARAARALGWTETQAQSVSLQSLRDLVRPVDPHLADEMSASIRGGGYVAQPSSRERELHEMKELLEEAGYHPLHAHALLKEGMGPHELRHRLRDPNDLERTHNFTRGAAPSATNTPLPGYRRPALHPRGKAHRAPKAWVPDADFDLRSEMETGYTIAEDRGNLYSIAYSGRAVHTIADFEAAVRYVAQLQVRNADFSNVFSVNERGNVDLLRLLKKRPYYRVLHSWV